VIGPRHFTRKRSKEVIKVPPRERILSIGITGSGKSYQWLTLADQLRPGGVKFHCIDTDDAIDYMLQTQFPQLQPSKGGNVYIHPAREWPEYVSALAEIKKQPLKQSDWLVVDMIDAAWEAVQSYFVNEVFKKNLGEYFLQTRKLMEAAKTKSTTLEALDGWKDWVVINNLYFDWYKTLIFQTPCNLYMTSKVESLAKKEDPEIKNIFGDIGVKPTGQKALGHGAHTIFLMLPGKQKWYITTVKDRAGRHYFDRTLLVSLYMQYFIAEAGWVGPNG